MLTGLPLPAFELEDLVTGGAKGTFTAGRDSGIPICCSFCFSNAVLDEVAGPIPVGALFKPRCCCGSGRDGIASPGNNKGWLLDETGDGCRSAGGALLSCV